jgi:hypothetical protein
MRIVKVLVVLAAIVGVAPSIAFADPPPADWGGHGGSHGGHGGHGGHHGSGDGGGSGGVIVDPGPYGTDAPYPYPGYPYPGEPSPGTPGQPSGQDAMTMPPPMPLWYYCDRPGGYYPYVKTCEGDWQGMPPAPPPPGAGPPISDVAWDYCDDVKGYYPYVASCKHHWVAIQASVPDEEASTDRPPAIAMWFYCTKAKGYFPYVRNCAETWRMMPAIPPANVLPVPKNTAAVP